MTLSIMGNTCAVVLRRYCSMLVCKPVGNQQRAHHKIVPEGFAEARSTPNKFNEDLNQKKSTPDKQSPEKTTPVKSAARTTPTSTTYLH